MFSETVIGYTIKLIKNFLDGEPLPVLPEEMDFDELYQFARFHKVEVMVYTALKKLDVENKVEKLKKFENLFYQNILISEKQKSCYELAEKAFIKEGIMFVPLKGSLIKDLYPHSVFRSLSDIDIYIGKKNASKAREIMESLGFTTFEYGSKVLIHDTYEMEGVHFELHKELMPHIPYFKGVEVCPQIEADVLEEDGKFRLSNEGFYMFTVIHIAKHIKHNGIGLRGFIDIHLFLKKHKETLDWKKIDGYLEKSGLNRFHDCLLHLVDFWFEDKTDVAEEIREFGKHIAQNGAIGDAEIMDSAEKYKNTGVWNKAKYLKNLIFLPYEYMADKYHILKKKPFLLPLCWCHRWFVAIISKREKFSGAMHKFDGIDSTKGEYSEKLKNNIGL